MAISALRAQAEAEKNEPLTLNELREMDGEPVWVVPLEKEPDWNPCWVIYGGDYSIIPSKTKESRAYLLYLREDYGKTWLAYRRKPEDTP